LPLLLAAGWLAYYRFRCDMTTSDIAEIVGYLFSSFVSGYVAGFLSKVFYKALGLIK
jgi:hypothetical protein